MTSPSRRTFIAAAGAGSATAALGLAHPAYGIDLPATDLIGQEAKHSRAEGPLVAYIEDPRTGRVVVVRGDRRGVVTDRGLAARLAEAAKGGER